MIERCSGKAQYRGIDRIFEIQNDAPSYLGILRVSPSVLLSLVQKQGPLLMKEYLYGFTSQLVSPQHSFKQFSRFSNTV